MGFSSLYNLWTLVFPAALLLYYLFRKRFQPKTVSSVLFWQADRQEEHVSPFIRNLQRNSLFYLQLFALLLFVWLLLGPYLKQDRSSGVPLFFVVDSSAAMLASPGGTSLFDSSREAMKKLMLDEEENRPVTIITTGEEPAVALEAKSPSEAAAVLDKLRVNYADPSMQQAIELVRAQLGEENAEVHIFTDRFDRSEFKEETEGVSWQVHANSRPAANRSIVRFGAVRSGGTVTAIVKLSSDSETAQPGTVLLKDAATGTVLAQKPTSGEPDEEETIAFKDVKTDAAALSAELQTKDDYAADNVSFALLGNEPRAIAVDPSLHELLRKAVEAIQEDIITDDGNRSVPKDALRITRSSDALTEGDRPVLLIGRVDAESEAAEGDLRFTDDPLFSVAAPKEMYVESVYPPFEGYEILARIGDSPLIQRSPRGDLIFLADLEATDWPLQPTFPLFIWSAVKSLSEESATLGTFTPMQRKSVLMASPADLYDMEGEYLSTAEAANTLEAPARPGIYRAADGSAEKLLAVQLAPSQHTVNTGESYTAGKLAGTTGTTTTRKPIVWPFVLVLLVLMTAEWEVQRRRGYPY
ncbi:hypothetical protein NCCP2716_01450 [Sporosarcina sp. NCCP-2716]|uniref:vWA domain-containing protein n=1 Tax=Sporosarcina sp. NCCP-2716 TaxID=2943679 RepID=UPI00203B668E|nr:BatA and WFA domain-containing protein [Sporosarcina sp. NCCP-2716]GKV67647.1 hypothetical protein NCCP2716_01450 [Sporosarcina sp. NCCP-2716]